VQQRSADTAAFAAALQAAAHKILNQQLAKTTSENPDLFQTMLHLLHLAS
jgi:hypothetical protein